jgi:bleomycin hydrolase
MAAGIAASAAMGQTIDNRKDGGYHFTILKETKASDVKNQNKSGTCWSFSTNSFLESEIERLGKGKVDLSEMYIVRKAYELKAIHYVRLMGKTQLGPGGEPHDVIDMVREYGLMPQEAYPGMANGEKINHSELDAVMKGYLDEVIKLHNGKLSNHWLAGAQGILDAYLGKVPETFNYQGKSYNAKSFADQMGIKADDYIELTSFTHHPFYKSFAMEVPDNWSWGFTMNIPLDELQQITENALNNGYTIEWASDVSEKGFSFKNGVAVVPFIDYEDMTAAEKDSMFKHPETEKQISQELRQQGYDDLSTQDDHGMQLTGIAKDQSGTTYYQVKNSWGTDHNDLKGYFYCSSSYFRYKTTAILVNKNSIPKNIAKKIGF